jgi:hypothetical protein
LQGEYLNRVVVEKNSSSWFKYPTYVALALLVFVVIVFQRRRRRWPLA